MGANSQPRYTRGVHHGIFVSPGFEIGEGKVIRIYEGRIGNGNVGRGRLIPVEGEFRRYVGITAKGTLLGGRTGNVADLADWVARVSVAEAVAEKREALTVQQEQRRSAVSQ